MKMPPPTYGDSDSARDWEWLPIKLYRMKITQIFVGLYIFTWENIHNVVPYCKVILMNDHDRYTTVCSAELLVCRHNSFCSTGKNSTEHVGLYKNLVEVSQLILKPNIWKSLALKLSADVQCLDHIEMNTCAQSYREMVYDPSGLEHPVVSPVYI